jgi:RNA polymerase sigma-70 factor (ECF subfamily)
VRAESPQPLHVTGDPLPVSPDGPPTPNPAAERALVERACRGDARAVEDLYNVHVHRIFRYVMAKVGNATEAEDITAEIFVKMVEALPRYQQRDVPFQAWLFRIASNQVVDHYRRGSNRQARSLEDLDFADPKTGPEELVEMQRSLAEVFEAVKKLPEAQRRVIELRFGADRSVRETAQILNKSENNVKVLQFKAIEKLRKLLGGR